MSASTLEETAEEKDLGIWTDRSLKPSIHLSHAVCNANQLLGMIRRSFMFVDRDLMTQLFTTMIRLHLEYCNVVWHPCLKQDIELLEGVQHRATKMVPGLAKLSYEERLQKMNLPSLVYHRTRGESLRSKYLHGLYKVDCSELLALHKTGKMNTRSHSLKLKKRSCKLNYD